MGNKSLNNSFCTNRTRHNAMEEKSNRAIRKIREKEQKAKLKKLARSKQTS